MPSRGTPQRTATATNHVSPWGSPSPRYTYSTRFRVESEPSQDDPGGGAPPPDPFATIGASTIPRSGERRTVFERFTERARQVVVLAQDEARALKHNYIGTEHILLGLLREEEGL